MIVEIIMVTHYKKRQRKGKKICSHLAGLEPATFRLTAERANRLRHKCLLVLVFSLLYVILDDVDPVLSFLDPQFGWKQTDLDWLAAGR